MTTLERLAKLPAPEKARPSTSLTVGLVIPPTPFVVPTGWEWVHQAPWEGPSIVAAILKGLGHRVTLLDQRDDPEPLALAGRLDFDVVAIATYQDNFPYIRRLAELAKKEAPRRPVILGGPLVTSIPEVVMGACAADWAVVGEGELTIIELFDLLTRAPGALPAGEILGLAWKDESGAVRLNARRPQLAELDVVPFQDLEAWPRTRAEGRVPELFLSYSRGCANACSFCYRPMPKLARKSIARVRQELEAMKPYAFEMAWWNDLTFTTDHPYVHRLLDEAFPVHPHRWCAFARVDSVDAPLLAHMKRRGCDVVLYGFEAINPAILAGYRKGTSENAIVQAIRLTREANLKVGGLFIIGAPEETPESLATLTEFCREFKEITRVKYLSAIPGTPLYHQALKQGIIRDPIAHLDFLSRERSVEEDVLEEGFVHFPKAVTREQLRQAYRTINGLIEQRPYDYRTDGNTFLESGTQFKTRPVTRAK